MAGILQLLIHFITILIRLGKPGGTKSLIAENLILANN